jgi:glycosyltransferase involved in cell wall biosynthesis
MAAAQKTKVLYLITKSNWGGAQRYVYDLATNLDPDRFEPVVVLGGDGTLKELLVHAGIRVIPVKTLERDVSLKKEWAFVREFWSILKTEKPHILHVNSSKAGALGTLLGRLARIPRVFFTAHGWAFNEDRPALQKLAIKSIHWLTVLFSHKTIAVSNAIITQMDWSGAQKKMKLIHPGRSIGVMYDKDEARTKLASENTKLQSHLGDIWILTIAELHPIKRINRLIEAIALVKEETSLESPIRSVIIGAGSTEAELAAQIKASGLSQDVFLLGSITEAARFLPAGDLFILPSKSESYGYVLHEAGLAGLPTIATNVGGIPDIITHNRTGRLVPPDNTKALAKEITHFLQHQKDWQNYGRNLQSEMKLRSTKHMVDATTALYTLAI